MPLHRTKKPQSNSSVQPPKNTKRARKGEAAGTSNLPKDPLPTTNSTESTANKTVPQASTAKEPAEELLISPSALMITIPSSDKPDPFADFP